MAVMPQTPDRQEERRQMVDEQLRRRGISDARVLEAFYLVPRHLFIPNKLQADAYADHALPIDAGQTISQPYVVAYMSESLQTSLESRVLEIGTGSGYQAAILSRMVFHVYTVERIPELAEQAAKCFAQLGYDNISIHVGDGTLGWPEQAPYDHAMITAAAPHVPRAIVGQVRRGGTVVLPIGGQKSQRLLRLRVNWRGFSREDLGSVQFVPLLGRYGWREGE
ncbi:MAG TPA: protein-L-isoaspartate(D-aspartate) O-methyltransferase [Aggregatilineales bacterium]|nr:protein-L-isoaspartate(D-aspartate) O-methyltransferase [Aggregatilineales bacterium]